MSLHVSHEDTMRNIVPLHLGLRGNLDSWFLQRASDISNVQLGLRNTLSIWSVGKGADAGAWIHGRGSGECLKKQIDYEGFSCKVRKISFCTTGSCGIFTIKIYFKSQRMMEEGGRRVENRILNSEFLKTCVGENWSFLPPFYLPFSLPSSFLP